MTKNYLNFLKSTFFHLKKFNKEKEEQLWNGGVTTIEELEKTYSENLLFEDINNKYIESIRAIENKNIKYFKKKITPDEYYRIAYSFYNDVIFLDIETTGLSREYCYITMIGWIYRGKYKYFIKGNDISELKSDLESAKIIITFNGAIFDLPFIKHEYPGLNIPLLHIDLRFFAKRYNYTGGQKNIEEILKFRRKNKSINGKEAVVLWYKYLKNDTNSLKLLIQYNYYDVLGMTYILDNILKKHILGKQFKIKRLKEEIYLFFKNVNKLEITLSEEIYNKTQEFIKGSPFSLKYNHIVSTSKRSKSFKVIGIDLTGSSKKSSGCSVIFDSYARTLLIDTDEKLINFIIEENPDIVSIDSPLSLPHGRTKVEDDDIYREFGIIRACERELKKRGVGVYPCLIRSMQGLTKRGINLAKEIRKLGFPVIESFPGAAQDVLRIPRKRTDISLLKEGLIDFGIRGDFEYKDISHDELDAITSALVGVFFWTGNYEALGDNNEDYLIIPEISLKDNKWKDKIVIGLSGPVFAGKTTIARIIEKKNFHYIRYSQVIEDIMKQKGLAINRESMQTYGLYIFQEKGQYWLNKELAKRFPAEGNIVIDGMRHPEDYTFMIETFGPNFYFMFVNANYELRKERYNKMGFNVSDCKKVFNHDVESNIKKIQNKYDYLIENEGSIDDLKKNVYEIIKILK